MPGITPRNKVLPLNELHEALRRNVDAKDLDKELRVKDGVLKVKKGAAWFGREASRLAHQARAIDYVAASVEAELRAMGEGLKSGVARSLQVDLMHHVRGEERDRPITCRQVVRLHELVQRASRLHADNADFMKPGEALQRTIGKWDPADHVKLADDTSLGFLASRKSLAALRKDTENVQPLQLRASHEEQGFWLDQAKRIATWDVDKPGALKLAHRAALLELPLAVRASMLLALAGRLAVPGSGDLRVVEKLYTHLAGAFEPHELLPDSERTRMKNFFDAAGELLAASARDWPFANDDERRRMLLFLSRHLGNQWPVPRAPLKLDADMADHPFALEGSEGLFLSAHADQGWGDFSTVLGHLITAWTLRSQPELAHRVGSGELDERDTGLQALARIMAAQLRSPFTPEELQVLEAAQGSPAQMHARALADLASTLLKKAAEVPEESVETKGD